MTFSMVRRRTWVKMKQSTSPRAKPSWSARRRQSAGHPSSLTAGGYLRDMRTWWRPASMASLVIGSRVPPAAMHQSVAKAPSAAKTEPSTPGSSLGPRSAAPAPSP